MTVVFFDASNSNTKWFSSLLYQITVEQKDLINNNIDQVHCLLSEKKYKTSSPGSTEGFRMHECHWRGYVTRILLFLVNSVLKSLLRAFTHTQSAPVNTMKRISNEFRQLQLTIIIFLVIFKNIASKLENNGPVFSSFSPFPSLPSVATNERKPLYIWNSVDQRHF